jgi:hypothetical protein
MAAHFIAKRIVVKANMSAAYSFLADVHAIARPLPRIAGVLTPSMARQSRHTCCHAVVLSARGAPSSSLAELMPPFRATLAELELGAPHPRL